MVVAFDLEDFDGVYRLIYRVAFPRLRPDAPEIVEARIELNLGVLKGEDLYGRTWSGRFQLTPKDEHGDARFFFLVDPRTAPENVSVWDNRGRLSYKPKSFDVSVKIGMISNGFKATAAYTRGELEVDMVIYSINE